MVPWKPSSQQKYGKQRKVYNSVHFSIVSIAEKKQLKINSLSKQNQTHLILYLNRQGWVSLQIGH